MLKIYVVYLETLGLFTVAVHLRAAALMETQHFFSKGHSA